VIIQTREILESEFVSVGEHFGFDFIDLFQSEGVDRLRRHVSSCDAADGEAITCCSIGQRPDSWLGATVRRVFVANVSCEALVSGHDLVRDRSQNGIAYPLLLGCRHARWEILHWLGKRAAFASFARDVVCFGGDFLEEIARGHQSIAHTLLHVCGQLIERVRNLMQACQVAVVVGNRVERSQCDQIRQFEMHPAHLIHWHLPVLELCPFDLLLQLADHQFAA
jgi:hypothetical protein